MIAVVSVGFTTTLLISKGLRTVKQQVSFQDTQGITAEVVAIFVPLLQQSAGKLWPHHFQAVKTQSAGLYLKLPLY